MKQILRKLLVHDLWHIGVVSVNDTAELLSWDMTGRDLSIAWMPGRKGYYSASPFVVTVDGQTVVFYQEYSYRGNNSELAYRTINKNTSGDICFGAHTPLAKQNFNRSYPFVFFDSGVLYMIPEESESAKVSLYRATQFPLKWEKVTTLLDDFAGIDPSIVWYKGRYWMFVTRKDSPDEKLYIFWADTLTGPWTAHSNNPVKQSSSNVRGAGTPFVIDNILYRPSQNCALDYGSAVIINRISTLTPTEFAEVSVHKIKPPMRFSRGIHTISYDEVGKLMSFDAKESAGYGDVCKKLSVVARKKIIADQPDRLFVSFS